MRYWLFDGQSARGPYAVEELKRFPGFGLETVVAPEDAQSAESWKPAGSFSELKVLFVPPPPARRARVPAQPPKPESPEKKDFIEIECSRCARNVPAGAYCIHCGARIGAPRRVFSASWIVAGTVAFGAFAVAAILWLRTTQAPLKQTETAKIPGALPNAPVTAAKATSKMTAGSAKTKPTPAKPLTKKPKRKTEAMPAEVKKGPAPESSQGTSNGPRKSVVDMTPQELESYLKRQAPKKQ